jgi:hypothetical protein
LRFEAIRPMNGRERLPQLSGRIDLASSDRVEGRVEAARLAGEQTIARRTVMNRRTFNRRIVATETSSGFDWADASVGAGVVLLLLAGALGAAAATHRIRLRTPVDA